MCRNLDYFAEHSIHKLLFAAILLTGSLETAELIVVESISSANSGEDLRTKVLESSIAAPLRFTSKWAGHRYEMEQTYGLLPSELKSVLNLPRRLRQSFVLRSLLQLSRECCAELLGTNKTAVDDANGLAIQELARLALKQESLMATLI